MIRLGGLSAQRGDARVSLTREDLADRAVARRRAREAGGASPVVVRDPARLEALRGAGLLDTAAEAGYDPADATRDEPAQRDGRADLSR